MGFSISIKQSGYDLIESPIRNHNLLQIWKKTPLDRVDLYYTSIDHAFKGPVPLPPFQNTALNLDSNKSDKFDFNLGATVLEELLKSMGLGALELTTRFSNGKSISIVYDNAYTIEIPVGDLTRFMATADLTYPNPNLVKDLNRDNIFVITGVLYAKNLSIEIETNNEIGADVSASVLKVADGKLDLKVENEKKIKLTPTGDAPIVVAVKAHRIVFSKGHFKKLELVTDTRDLF